MARPWQCNVEQHCIPEHFKAADIGMVLNLQVRGFSSPHHWVAYAGCSSLACSSKASVDRSHWVLLNILIVSRLPYPALCWAPSSWAVSAAVSFLWALGLLKGLFMHSNEFATSIRN